MQPKSKVFVGKEIIVLKMMLKEKNKTNNLKSIWPTQT